MFDALITLDQAITLIINQAHSPSADNLMMMVSNKLTWIPLYAGLLFLLVRVFGWKRSLAMVAFAVIGVILSDQVSVLMKEGFQRLRPCHAPALLDALHLPNGCGGRFGFVSSHAANTMGLAVLMSLTFRNRWLTASLLAYAVINAYSRVYLGQHYLLDVIMGAALGALIGYLMYKTMLYTIKRSKIK
jgi:undecaprenyl-diphosphatase